jgi:two-component system response regulator GlrR
MEALTRYGWPGNVRELINAIERAVLLASGSEIGMGDLPRRIVEEGQESARAAPSPGEWQPGRLPAAMLDQPLRNARRSAIQAFERDYLGALLNDTRGRIGETARRAGVNERTLWDLMKRHQLRKETFKGR